MRVHSRLSYLQPEVILKTEFFKTQQQAGADFL